MTPEQIDEAARALAAARKGKPIAALPEGVRPQSEADSYAIQEAVLRRLGERPGGYKVGFSPQGGIFCAPTIFRTARLSTVRRHRGGRGWTSSTRRSR